LAGIEGTYEEICRNVQLRKEILSEINEIGKNNGLKSFEMAKNIYLEPTNFQGKGILSTTMKVQRH
jgi:long-chain acyl-CoA synthetase